MNYISICSGIEAASVAWTPLGWSALAFAEIEKFPSAVLAHHYPSVPNLGDMTKYREWPEHLLADCDVLVGGPPCQAFSVAGLRYSLSDERGNLTLIYVNLLNHIDAIRKKHGRLPVIAVYENVPGIYSTRDNAFGCLVGAICGQDAAVETETGKWPTAGILWGSKRRVGYRTLDAQYFGLAQRRRRCFLVAVHEELVRHFGNRACPSEILSIAHSLSGHPAPSREKGQGFAHDTAPCLTSSGRGVERSGDTRGQDPVIAVASTGDISHCLNAGGMGRQDYETETLITHSLRGEGFDASEDGTGRGTPLIPVQPYTLAIRGRGDSHNLEYRQDGTANALLTPNGGRGGIGVGAIAYRTAGDGATYEEGDKTAPLTTGTDQCSNVVAFAQNTRDEVREMAVVGALAAHPGMKQTSYIRQSMQVRRLTPRECERLQGFPDDYTLIDVRGKQAADGPRYKALGNSMAVPVMAWIGKRIDEVSRTCQ